MIVSRISAVRLGVGGLVAASGLFFSSSSFAQTDPGSAAAAPAAPAAPAAAPAAQASASGSASVTTNGSSSSASTSSGSSGGGHAESAGDSDHDRFVGSFAIGYLGASTVPIADFNSGGSANSLVGSASTINAPVIGVRYWLNELIGIDAGIGLRTWGGTTKYDVYNAGQNPPVGEVELKKVSQWGLIVHAGVPLALKNEKHFSFQVIPEVNVGTAKGTYQYQHAAYPKPTTPLPGDVDLGGFRLDVGARVGAEVHFGFIGIPNLSLQAGVGLHYAYTKYSLEGGAVPNGRPSLKSSDSTSGLATSVEGTPWAIFTNNVSALYYF